MGFGAGLLTVAGRAGEGGFKGMSKNIDEAIEKKKAEALEKRLLNLEKVKAGYRAAENVTQREFTSGENVAQREFMAGENISQRDFTAEQNRLQREVGAAEGEAERTWKAKQPGELEKTHNFLKGIVGDEEATEIMRTGGPGQAYKTKTDKDRRISKAYIDGANTLAKDPSMLTIVNDSLKLLEAPKQFVLDEETGTFELVSAPGESDSVGADIEIVKGRIGKSGKQSQKKGKGLLEQSPTFQPLGSRSNATQTGSYW